MNEMRFSIHLLFHGSLNDFLSKKYKGHRIEYICIPSSSMKDTIEAIGVPHVEIGKILANQREVKFDYQPQPGDSIEVFPNEGLVLAGTKSFVLDVHLGALARLLRMMGIDTAYRNDYSDQEIIAIATGEQRAVLTRDIGLLKNKTLNSGYWLRSQDAQEQFGEVVKRFALCSSLQPFTRCITCNGLLKNASKSEVLPLIQPQTNEYFNEFWQCTQCKKIYWKGSHFQRMEQKVFQLKSLFCQ